MATAYLTAAGLGPQILKLEDTQYKKCIDSFCDSSAKLHPVCILQPRIAAEVAEAVKALVSARQKFAVRSGARMWKPDREQQHQWRGRVYNELETVGHVVAGGRVDNVGAGGLLLGGGLSFYSGRDGFDYDAIVAYQVVLADGTIVAAKFGEHEDLFRVLNSGSNNFGIVSALSGVSASVKTPELAEWVRPKVHAITQELAAFARAVEDGIMPWLYLNYAAADQEPLQSYGAENVAKMRAVAAKYDPNGVLQSLCPGGFKISAVENTKAG